MKAWGGFQRVETREGRGTGDVPEVRQTREEKALSWIPH
jgi:hypothetical protein